VPALPIEGNDTSGAIRVAFATMPSSDQAALLASLGPAPAPNLDEQIIRQPVEVLEALAARHFTREALRRRRIAERNEELRVLARLVIAEGGPIRGKPLARAVRRTVERYETTAWPRERSRPEPADPHRAVLWRILSLGAGSKLPEAPQLVRILAGLA
jgi:hypothetical protein